MTQSQAMHIVTVLFALLLESRTTGRPRRIQQVAALLMPYSLTEILDAVDTTNKMRAIWNYPPCPFTAELVRRLYIVLHPEACPRPNRDSMLQALRQARMGAAVDAIFEEGEG